MKNFIRAAGVLVVILTLAGCAPERSSYYGRQHMRHGPADTTAQVTKADVIKMSQAKIGDGVIINMIKSTGSEYNLRSQDVVELADSGVSDSVINAMIATTNPNEKVEHGHTYYVYPDWYWYGYDPFWDPWYGSFYFGIGPRFYRPYFGFYGHGGFARGGFRGRR